MHNMSIDADPQQQAAASPLVLVVRSFLRCIDVKGAIVAVGRSQATTSPPWAIPAASRLRRTRAVAHHLWAASIRTTRKRRVPGEAQGGVVGRRAVPRHSKIGAMVSTQSNRSIDTDPQQQGAAPPLMLVVRSFLLQGLPALSSKVSPR
jgi:hypothetical protein